MAPHAVPCAAGISASVTALAAGECDGLAKPSYPLARSLSAFVPAGYCICNKSNKSNKTILSFGLVDTCQYRTVPPLYHSIMHFNNV